MTGVEGTSDDKTLFVDCEHKYRNSGRTPYANWFYPLSESIFASHRYRIGEPGFDVFQADDRSIPPLFFHRGGNIRTKCEPLTAQFPIKALI